MSHQAKVTFEQTSPSTAQELKPPTLYIAWALGLCTLLCFAMNAQADNPSRIVKWKDEKGVTHYGDKIPPQYVNRENSVINKQGVTVKHNRPVDLQDQAQDLAKLEQDKKDKALLGAFTNAEEIDLARDRNIQLDLIALENLNQDKTHSQKQLTENRKQADSFMKRKQPIPADLNAELLANKEEITKIDQRINERKRIIENTRKRFEEDKKRYLELKNPGTTAMPASQSAPTAIEKQPIPPTPDAKQKPATNVTGSNSGSSPSTR